MRSEPNGRATPLSQIRQPTGHAFGRKTADDELHEEDGARRTSSSPRSDHALWASDDEDSAPRADARGAPAAQREPGHAGNGAAPPEQAVAEGEARTGWRAVGSAPKSSLIDELAAEADDVPPWSEPAVPPDPDRRPDREAPVERARKQADADDGDDLQGDEFDDIAVTIGRVVSIRGSVVWGALFDDDDGTASRAARMGALVSMRGPDSRVFGIVNALKRDGNGGGQQAERTIFEIQVLGEISTATPGRPKAAGFQRGVSQLSAARRAGDHGDPARPRGGLCPPAGVERPRRPAAPQPQGARLRPDRQSARQALRRARHDRRRQVLRGDR